MRSFRLAILLAAAVWCTAGMTIGHRAGAADLPNIIILYADDAGYADFGFQSITDKAMVGLTPHIDSIAATGARFTNAYMSGAVCSPSRAGMLTGRYQERFGHELNIPPGYMKGGLPLSEKTMAARLKHVGYTTGIIGKWHLGYPPAYQPNRRGFDFFLGLLQGSRPYFPMKKPTPHRVIQRNGKATPETGYVTDRFGEGAIEFIKAHRDRPFFLYVSFTSPHGPLQAKPSDLKQLEHITDRRRRIYAAMVKCMDDNVGRILNVLRETGLDDRTLVVFTNDNGGQTKTGAVNTPLRGRKGQMWEGGIRVPMAMKWPGRIDPGITIDDPVIALDLLPTFLAAAGRRVDPAWKLDGVNLLPRLTGKESAIPERPLFWRIHGPDRETAVRLGKWKLIQPDQRPATRPLLFNLEDDIGESNDVAAMHPEQVTRLSAILDRWERQLVDPLWRYGRAKQKRRSANR